MDAQEDSQLLITARKDSHGSAREFKLRRPQGEAAPVVLSPPLVQDAMCK